MWAVQRLASPRWEGMRAWEGARHLNEVDGALEEGPLLVHLHQILLVALCGQRQPLSS